MAVTESFITIMENVESRVDYTIVSDCEAAVKRKKRF